MARKKREWFKGAIYHIMARGNHREKIFQDREDFQIYLTILRDAVGKYGVKLHAFCLMTNHYHLLLETSDQPVWLMMKRVNHLYASYYNHKYGYIGHLFQGRYKSCLVKTDAYFLQTSRYIHLNPVKAGMVGHAEDYEWSSYRELIMMNDCSIVERGKTWAYFKAPENLAYRQFVEDMSLNRYEKKIQKDMGEDDLWLPW